MDKKYDLSEKVQGLENERDCFASLAMTKTSSQDSVVSRKKIQKQDLKVKITGKNLKILRFEM